MSCRMNIAKKLQIVLRRNCFLPSLKPKLKQAADGASNKLKKSIRAIKIVCFVFVF